MQVRTVIAGTSVFEALEPKANVQNRDVLIQVRRHRQHRVMTERPFILRNGLALPQSPH